MARKNPQKPRNPIAVICFERFGKTTKVMHDRRRPRDRNRAQTNDHAITESV